MNVLLHTCCGPCASHCIRALREAGHDVTLFYSNSNIWPPDEFRLRQEHVEKLGAITGTPVIVDPPDHEEWEERVAKGYEQEPENGERCSRCFRYNLTKTYAAMEEHGFEAFTTSLTVSPHKPSPTILAIGKEVGGDRFLPENFKKKDGYLDSLRLSREYGLYRQNYCGCPYSQRPAPLRT